MKTRLVALLLVLWLLPLLAACGLFGNSEQERYEQQMEAYQKQLEAYQKWQEEYYQSLQQAINDYNKAYAEWQQQELQQKLQQLPEGGQVVVVVVSENQTEQ